MRGISGLVSLALLLAHAGGCRREMAPVQAIDVVRAVVTILPQAYFVERVGGSRVAVQVLVGTGQSYHSYEPTPRQIADLSEAQVFFTIGVPFERTLEEKVRSTRPDLVVVDTRAGVAMRHATDHCGHEGHDHGEGGMDPHIWLDAKLVKAQAATIAAALARLDPDNADEYEKNLRAFQADLDAADQRAAAALAPFKGREFFVFHPTFGYFGDAYGLKQVAVEEGGKEPGGRQLAAMIEQARQTGARAIFVQPQFSSSAARTVAAEIGAEVVTIDPLARDYLNNYVGMAEKIAASLRTGTGQATDRVTQAQ
ncbi:MAG TPA: zinc ABC transporter substrate-binding protein [Phycisphaerae bacterium]|nr:zinc ABC transporter substrate-binding protein [Phycisphaerae bacterium]